MGKAVDQEEGHGADSSPMARGVNRRYLASKCVHGKATFNTNRVLNVAHEAFSKCRCILKKLP
jgi:hypothetical protein